MASPELEAKIKQVKDKYGEKKPESFDQQVARVKEKYRLTRRLKQMRKTMADDLKKEHIGFKKLEHKVEAEGHSEESAKKIAAAVGRKKYGAKGMAAKAHEGMKKAKVDEGKSPMDKKIAREGRGDVYTPSSGYDHKGVHHANYQGKGTSESGGLQRMGAGQAPAVKEKHKQVLNDLKSMKKPSLTKSEDGMHDEATHSHNGVRLQHMKDLGDGHHAFRVLEGHHAGKWTKLHESEAEPIQKAAPMEQPMPEAAAPAQAEHPAQGSEPRSPVKALRALKHHLPEHLEKHVDGVSDEKFDSCVDQVKHQGGKYNPYAVCTASLKKMRQYVARDHMEKGEDCDAVGGMRKMKAALHADSPMEKSKSDEHLTRDAKHAARESRAGGEKGVHTTDRAAHLTPGKASPTGSKAGNQIRRGVPQYAKEEHQKKLGELKSMKKPNLEKSTGHEEGVHAEMGDTKNTRGKSPAGEYARAGHKDAAKNMHQKTLASLQGMKKPNLEKSAPEPELEKSKEWEVPGEVP